MASATSSLLLAVRALAAGDGTVAVPAFGFPSAALAGVWNSRRVAFVDTDDATFNIRLDALDEILTSQEIGCVVAIAVAGNLSGIPAVYQRCRASGVPFILDAAGSVGHNQETLSDFADAVVLSLSSKKALPLGEGGVVLCRSSKLRDRLRQLRVYGYGRLDGFELAQLGLNARMSEFTAAIGNASIEFLPRVLARRRALSEMLRMSLVRAGMRSQHVESESLSCLSEVVSLTKDRDRVCAELRRRGVDAVPFYHPILSDQAPFHDQGHKVEIARELAQESLGIKVFSTWTEQHVEQIVLALAELR
jgi:dTDP-4-amino-4,6-dideoxygalactose transaminase